MWDIGGKLVYGGEQNGEYFATGSDFGVNLFLKNIMLAGAIWMVNINQDIEQLYRSKQTLHTLFDGYPQLQDI